MSLLDRARMKRAGQIATASREAQQRDERNRRDLLHMIHRTPSLANRSCVVACQPNFHVQELASNTTV